MTPLDYAAFDFMARVHTHRSVGRLGADLSLTISQFGFRHSMISRVPVPGERWSSYIQHIDYPVAWTDHYVQQKYAAVDPMARQLRRTVDPCIWSRVPVEKGSAAWQMMRAAADYGLAEGIAIPIINGRGARAVVTFAAPHREFARDAVKSLMLIGICAHHALQIILEGDEAPLVEPLNSRQIECIKWLAAGKSQKATADALSITPRTVKFHLATAAQKLGVRTGPQLVHAAFRQGFLN